MTMVTEYDWQSDTWTLCRRAQAGGISLSS
jgi:hypothetical protein